MENRTDSTDRVTIPSHVNELSRSLYKLQQENQFCDVQIIGEDGSIAAHSIILSAISSYFRQCIVISERKEGCVSIYFNGILINDMQNLITFIYTGYINLTSESIQRTMKLLQFVNLNNAVEYINEHVCPMLQKQSHVSYDSSDNGVPTYKQPAISFEIDNNMVDQKNQQKHVENANRVICLTETVTQDLSSEVNSSHNNSFTQGLGCSVNLSKSNSTAQCLGSDLNTSQNNGSQDLDSSVNITQSNRLKSVTGDLDSSINTTHVVEHFGNSQNINDILQFNLGHSIFQTVKSKSHNNIENPSNIDCGLQSHENDYDSSTCSPNQNENDNFSHLVKEERLDLGCDKQTADKLQQNRTTANLNLDCEEIVQESFNVSSDVPHDEVEINDGCLNESVLKESYGPKRGRKQDLERKEKCKASKTKNPEHRKQRQRVLRSDNKNVTVKLTSEKTRDKSINTRKRKLTGNRNVKMINKNTIKINFKNDNSENGSRNQTLKNKQREGVKSQKNKQCGKTKKKQRQIEIERKKCENEDNSEINIPVVKEENVVLDNGEQVTSEIVGVVKENVSQKRTWNNNTVGSEIGNSSAAKKKKKNPRTHCLICNLNFENPESYLAHRNEKHKTLHPEWNEEKKLYVCNYKGCNYQMRNRGFVARHKDLVHGEPIDESQFNIFRCEVEGCNYYHIQKSRIKAHLKDHSAEISVICDICGKGYKHKKGLLLHKKSHIPEEERTYKFCCSICDKRFFLKSSFTQHMKRHTEKNTILCHLCPYNNNCDSQKQLDIHLFKVHQVPLPGNIAVYRCSQCDYYTFYKNVFNSHLSKHAGEKFDCDVCGKSFGSKMNLRGHKRRHTVEKVKCPYDQCNYYGFKVDMRDHLLSMHKFKNSKPFACHLCDYRCSLQGNLTKHLRGKHKLEVQTTSTLWQKLMETGQGYDTIFDQSRAFAIERVERTPITYIEETDQPVRPQQEEPFVGVVPPVSGSLAT